MTDVHRLRHELRAKLRSGHPIHGTFVKIPTIDGVGVMAAAGFDFLVLDREHSQMTAEQAQVLAAYSLALGVPCLIRLPRVDSAEINRLLEAGAAGIQLSMTSSAMDVGDLRTAARYAPVGGRSLSLSHGIAAFGTLSLADYLDRESANPPVLVCQVETATTTDPIAALAAGVDVLFVGTTDLAVSIGLDHPDRDRLIQDVMSDVVAAARTEGIAAGGWAADAPSAQGLVDAGFSYLVVASDVQVLSQGTRTLATSLRDQQSPAEQ